VSKAKSGVDKAPRVGSCVSCELAVYADNQIAYLGELMHPACHRAQQAMISEWNNAVRKDKEAHDG
jgi:hypothetical protein